jgi:hypothetical protein
VKLLEKIREEPTNNFKWSPNFFRMFWKLFGACLVK